MKISADVVDSNTAAVSLIMHGKLAESLRVIRTALTGLNEVIEQGASAPSPDANMAEATRSSPIAEKDMIDSVTVSVDPQTLSNAHYGVFHFFNRAIVVDAPEALGDESHVIVDHYKISAVLLYNAGLCNHIKGLQSGSARDLATALHCYQYALSLLTDTNAIQAVSDQDALLVLALLNNMGHLNSQSFDHPASKICLETMRRIFPATESLLLKQEDSIFFYLTVFLVPVEQVCASPAA